MRFFLISMLLLFPLELYAFTKQTHPVPTSGLSSTIPVTPQSKNPLLARTIKEDSIPPNSFALMLYKPTYILPLYMTGSPDNAVYQGQTPDHQQLKKLEFKYQFSVKVPIWRNIRNYHSTLYLGYTQLSYWQLYNKSAFF